jgi:DNA-binding NtrC family response regulator
MTVSIKVLILEDMQSDAELMIHELKHAGFLPDWRRVDTQDQYLSALESVPDLILADYNLPQFDAFLALRLMQERKLDIPFIVVSGMITEESAIEFMKQGASDYLLKDRLGRLGQAAAKALEQRMLREDKRKAELALNQKCDELERFNNLTVDRELRMIELKKEVNALLKRAGEPEKYRVIGREPLERL